MPSKPFTGFAVFVEGSPKGQPRPRAFSRGGHARVYDPGTAEGWKSAIAAALRGVRPAQPYAGPLSLTLDFFFPRPKSHFRTGKRAGEQRDDAPFWHTSKPDADNAAKAVMDCLTEIGVWSDDASVVVLTVAKRYGNAGRGGVKITLEAFN